MNAPAPNFAPPPVLKSAPRVVQIDTLRVSDATFTDDPKRVLGGRTIPGVALDGEDGQVELYGAAELREAAAAILEIVARSERVAAQAGRVANV